MMTRCDTESMNFFLEKLSEQYTDDYILLICDGAAWHKSTELIIPENIELFFIPPYTPEMNPIEQIWKEIRKRGFQNEVFDTTLFLNVFKKARKCVIMETVMKNEAFSNNRSGI